MYVWFIGLNHSKYRFLFHAVYIGIMNAIRKSTFHAARYNWVKYLGSDVRSRPLQSVPRVCFGARMVVSRPEKGLQKRVNLMQQKTNSDLSRHYLPRQLRHLILQEYLSGVKTARQLSEEHGIPMSTIHKMGQRWKAKNSCSFVSTPNPYPIMSRVTSEEASELLSENKALRRRLEEALLRLEGYEIMGDILQEEYGIDLLKKSAAGQSSVSKKDTQQ
ncbi:MAG: hypothetical protein ACLS6N_05715 [Alistipes finegoldii]